MNWLKEIKEPAELTIFELVGMSVFAFCMFLFLNLYVSLFFMWSSVILMMTYSYLKKGRTRLWKKIKI